MNMKGLGIRKAIRKAGALRFASRRVETHTTAAERLVLYQLGLACGGAHQAVEIGSYLGASSLCIAAGLREHGPGATLYCVDTWQNETMPEGARDTYAEFLSNTDRVSAAIRCIRKRSENVELSDLPSEINLAFIDGDHGYEAVKGDVARLIPRLANGATVAFHDVKYFPGVSRLVGECLASNNWQLLGFVDNLAWLRYLADGISYFGISLSGEPVGTTGQAAAQADGYA
jgi:predicted O-methyltransferase YrrM